MKMNEFVAALTTCSSEAEAVRVARALLESRAAACVNVVPGLRSLYWWKGSIEESPEVLLVVKTTRGRAAQAYEVLRQAHSYEVPEWIELPVAGGSPAYLAWLTAELDDKRES